jgi:hypothetical protein
MIKDTLIEEGKKSIKQTVMGTVISTVRNDGVGWLFDMKGKYSTAKLTK